jgi:hypothetical protein
MAPTIIRKYFADAYESLMTLGMSPLVELGRPVSAFELDEIDGKTDFPMPAELRRFYLEMGDGFSFIPDTKNPGLIGWERTWLPDYCICNQGFPGSIDDDASFVLKHPNCKVEGRSLLEVAEARKKWLPFYGLSGDGSFLCIDMESSAIRYHDPQTWASSPETWNFVLAASLMDFIQRWSRFYFVSPRSRWTSFCWSKSGTFDWDPVHFAIRDSSTPPQ